MLFDYAVDKDREGQYRALAEKLREKGMDQGEEPRVKGKGKGKERADDAWGVDAVRRILGKWAQEKESDSPLAVAVVGVTNVRNPRYSLLPVAH